jgi:hypothetical protein
MRPSLALAGIGFLACAGVPTLAGADTISLEGSLFSRKYEESAAYTIPGGGNASESESGNLDASYRAALVGIFRTKMAEFLYFGMGGSLNYTTASKLESDYVSRYETTLHLYSFNVMAGLSIDIMPFLGYGWGQLREINRSPADMNTDFRPLVKGSEYGIRLAFQFIDASGATAVVAAGHCLDSLKSSDDDAQWYTTGSGNVRDAAASEEFKLKGYFVTFGLGYSF